MVCCLLVFGVQAFSQREIDESSSSFKDRMYLGGGFGLNGGSDIYGNRYFFVGLFPIIGYMVTNKISVGTSITYQYTSYPDFDRTISQYGFSPFARYNLGQVFLYGEYMILNGPSFISTQRKMYNRLLLGVGVRQPMGKRSSINAMGLYDFIYNRSDYAFASPWVFRVFFSF